MTVDTFWIFPSTRNAMQDENKAFSKEILLLSDLV